MAAVGAGLWGRILGVSKLRGERAFYTLDRDLRFVSASENTLALWGKSRADIIGKSFAEIFPMAAGGDTHIAIDEALRTFRPVRIETVSTYLGCPVEVEIYPVADGVQIGFKPVTVGRPQRARL